MVQQLKSRQDDGQGVEEGAGDGEREGEAEDEREGDGDGDGDAVSETERPLVGDGDNEMAAAEAHTLAVTVAVLLLAYVIARKPLSTADCVAKNTSGDDWFANSGNDGDVAPGSTHARVGSPSQQRSLGALTQQVEPHWQLSAASWPHAPTRLPVYELPPPPGPCEPPLPPPYQPPPPPPEWQSAAEPPRNCAAGDVALAESPGVDAPPPPPLIIDTQPYCGQVPHTFLTAVVATKEPVPPMLSPVCPAPLQLPGPPKAA